MKCVQVFFGLVVIVAPLGPDGTPIHSLISCVYFSLFVYEMVATIATEKKTERERCNFAVTVSECKQNNNKSCSLSALSLLLMLYCFFFCHFIASTDCVSRFHPVAYQLQGMFHSKLWERKRHFPTTHTLHTYSISILVAWILICSLSIFALVYEFKPYGLEKRTNLQRLSFPSMFCFFRSHFSLSLSHHSFYFSFNLLILPSYYDKTFKQCLCIFIVLWIPVMSTYMWKCKMKYLYTIVNISFVYRIKFLVVCFGEYVTAVMVHIFAYTHKFTHRSIRIFTCTHVTCQMTQHFYKFYTNVQMQLFLFSFSCSFFFM